MSHREVAEKSALEQQTTEQMHHHPKTFRVVVHLFSGLLLRAPVQGGFCLPGDKVHV
jgi:hypothetical protein